MKLKDQLIPHAGNNYQPHALQKAALLCMLVLVFVSFALANLQSLLWTSSDWLLAAILPAVIVSDTNAERSDEALVQLSRNPTLDQAAQLKAEDMAQNQYFDHYSPTGVSPWFWFGQAGYDFVHAGENLAVHFTDSSAVVKAWMNSPTHRANILSANFREIGIGVAEGTFGGYQTVFVVQLFGTPAAIAANPLATAESEFELAATSANEPNLQAAPITPSPRSELVAGVEENTSDQATATATSVPEMPVQATEPVEVVVDDQGVAMYSGFISTSTGGVPAAIEENSGHSESGKPFLAFITQPQLVLQILYAVIGLFVLFLLGLSIFIEARRQHPVQVAYGAGLLATMWLLSYIHVALTAGGTIL